MQITSVRLDFSFFGINALIPYDADGDRGVVLGDLANSPSRIVATNSKTAKRRSNRQSQFPAARRRSANGAVAHRGDHFNAGRKTIVIGGHGRNHRRMPMPYRATVVKTGCGPTSRQNCFIKRRIERHAGTHWAANLGLNLMVLCSKRFCVTQFRTLHCSRAAGDGRIPRPTLRTHGRTDAGHPHAECMGRIAHHAGSQQ